MISWLKRMERGALEAEIENLGVHIPDRYRNTFVRLTGAAEYSYILNRLVREHFPNRPKLKCLVVGLFGGRDYWNLKAQGHDVHGLDLGPVEDCPNSKAGNAEETWPYDDAAFDLVVLGEILEHLHYDMSALQQARRVLKVDGQLIATVPFLDSNDTYHIRVHDPLSFQRLLEINGFRVEHRLERPGLFGLHPLNYVSAGLAAVYYALTRESLYGVLTRTFGALEWHLGHQRLPRRLLKALALINWGGIYSCSVSAESYDYLATNISEFLHASPA